MKKCCGICSSFFCCLKFQSENTCIEIVMIKFRAGFVLVFNRFMYFNMLKAMLITSCFLPGVTKFATKIASTPSYFLL